MSIRAKKRDWWIIEQTTNPLLLNIFYFLGLAKTEVIAQPILRRKPIIYRLCSEYKVYAFTVEIITSDIRT